ncbi:MAG: hypothetical protein N3A72_05085 [bacterium]|nr:hypothetical protein [bacterium]
MKTIKLVFISLIFISLFITFSFAQETKIVIAEGRAAGTDLKAKDKAVHDALRNAVEQGVGVVLASTSAVKDFKLLNDLIITQTAGYVQSYELLEEGKEAGEYWVKVKAVVSIGKLNNDLLAKGLIYALKEKPLVMVLVAEKIDDEEQTSSNVGTKIESALLESGLELVDKSQLEQIKARDIALNYKNPEKAAALGKRFGADIVIVGEANAESAGTDVVYGETLYFYTANIDVKAVRADTGTILAVDSYTAKKGASGPKPAARAAFNMAGSKLAPQIVNKLFDRWRKEVYNQTDYQLVVSSPSLQKLTAFETALKKISNIQNVYRRLFFNNIGILNVDYSGTVSQLESDLTTMQNPKVEITSTTQNRLDIKIK